MPEALPLRLLSRVGVAVRPGELGTLIWSFLYFFFLLCGYYILRPLRDAMGIAGGEKALPWLFTATFVTMLAMVPLYGAVVARASRRRIIPYVYRFFALNLVLFFTLFELGVSRVAVGKVFFVWTSVYNLFVVSVFWSFMADVFTNEQGKRLFGAIAAGGSLGGIVGPEITELLAPRLGQQRIFFLLLLSALALEGCLLCVRRIQRAAGERGAAPPVGGSLIAGIRLVLTSPYLAGICASTLCLTATATFIYLEQAHIIATTTVDPAARTQLFASVDKRVNLVALLLEIVLTGRVLSRIGLGAGLAALPVVTGAGFIGLAAAPSLLFIAVFSGVRRAIHYAIERPAREVLFTVVDREAKYKAKTFIDTVVYRGGDAASARGYAALVGAGLGATGVAMLSVPLCALWLGVYLLLAQKQKSMADRKEAAGGNDEPAASAEGG
ncbi:NTP/NDP exchange transporter [Polyangium aurulentum]|uniref:NTP/NDP exchange transporter n=1 Tax=Polyangium aurulentum TaxID=2567896 RepID=UPI0010AE61BC|nr:MFS transporter [Polyangium aurulentum]UQA59425.1 MFS transporter [Polyangium aurulentum]